ncbi:hypothetical protein TELCIR_12666 [Teladorsagia circumcincta]|uniref:Uncharacterized protein n=1 Tax=Teladorsagia circumcincta TaxID=45464 RepID=A0A2G9U643_TELCI|nr:hypothetical protein TELCIR_12666 [Teladorsagia circumcincta]
MNGYGDVLTHVPQPFIGMAHGAYTRDKFLVCLPFNKGGTGEKNGTRKNNFTSINGSIEMESTYLFDANNDGVGNESSRLVIAVVGLR